MARVALFPGTFDPVTNGHLDVIARAAGLFDRLVVAVADAGSGKAPLLPRAERMELLRATARPADRVEVTSLDGLLVALARARGASAVVRGVRSYQDWEYELQMLRMNRHLAPALETVFLAPAVEHAFVSSSLVREVASLGGDVSGLVPREVAAALARRRARPG